MACCENCFDDYWLHQYFRENSTKRGNCSYCDSKNARLMPVGEVARVFEPIFGLYKPIDSDTMMDFEDPLEVGDSLLTLVQDDWGVFSQRLLDSHSDTTLLERLANANWEKDSGEEKFYVQDLYTRRVSWSHETLEFAFGRIVYEIGEDPDDEDVHEAVANEIGEELAAFEEIIPSGREFFRGRAGVAFPGVPHSGGGIGAPPDGQASPGRANAKGVSVLYVAREEKAAVAEMRVRAPKGPLSLCKARSLRDLRVLNVNKLPTINPFTAYRESLGSELEVWELLRAFGEELCKPVTSDEDPQEYRITQKLCEAIRFRGYDGILYGSTRREGGTNLVVFEPAVIAISDSWITE